MQIPMHLGKNSPETLYICSIDLPAAIGFFVPHTDFEILEICEFASNPDGFANPEISLLDENFSHQWKGIRKYLFDTIRDTFLVRLKLKGVNESQGQWEFFYSHGEFHYRNTDAQDLNIRLTQFLHFSHLPVQGVMNLLDTCMPKTILIEGYFGMEEVDLQGRMQTEIKFQQQNSWRIQHNEYEWENRFFEDYVPERLLPMDVQISAIFNRHPPVSFYLRRSTHFTNTVFLIFVDDNWEPLNPLYEKWLDEFYIGDWKSRLQQSVQHSIATNTHNDFFVLELENNQHQYQFSFLKFPKGFKQMELEDFESWFLERWNWTLNALDRSVDCAIFSLELYEGMSNVYFSKEVTWMMESFNSWLLDGSKQHCLFVLPQTRDDYERLMIEKQKFIPMVKDLNPADEIAFRFYSEIEMLRGSFTPNLNLNDDLNNPFVTQ